MSTKDTRSSGTPRRRREKKPEPQHNAPEVVYTPGKAFNRNRLILRLLTIVAVVLALSMGLSIFFRVDKVLVSGTEKYDPHTVQTVSGIQEGDSLLFFGKSAAAARIVSNLHYVRSVRFEVKLPGTVTIIIEESPTAYAIECSQGNWWMITADGRVVEQTDATAAANFTVIEGVKLQSPVIGEPAVALEPVQEGDTPVVITGADRLKAALSVVQALEANEILGQASRVDVSNLQAMEFWYGVRYQIKLGDGSDLSYKIAAAKATIEELGQYNSGVLDVSKWMTTGKVSVNPLPK